MLRRSRTTGSTTADDRRHRTIAWSHARRRLLAFGFLLTLVTYLDRICISVAAPFMMQELNLTVLQMSTVFSAFTIAYSVFEVPSGWLGDRRGPRRVLTRIVIWWSVFTALTGAARGFRSLVAIRFLFGAGEAGAFPNIALAFSRWFSLRERGRANSVLFLGSRVGGMLSAPLALTLITQWGWRASFAAFGLLGVVWAAAWYSWFRDDPAEHRDVDAEELRLFERKAEGLAPIATPWRSLFLSGNLWAICAMYFAFGYGLYFYFTWLPTFLIRELKFSVMAGGFFASLPFILAGIADVTGGWLTDRLSRSYGLRVGRCGLGFASFMTCAAFVAGSTIVPQPALKAMLLALALASADLGLCACWAVCLDIGERHAGVVTGFMNTFGNLGGLVGPVVLGFAVERWHSWTTALLITAAVYAAGAIAWLAIQPQRQIVPAADAVV